MDERSPTPAHLFAANLRRLRAEAGLTQEDLAFRAEIHRSQITMMEAGERCPRFDTFVRLIGALGVRADDLVAGIEWAPPDFKAGRYRIGSSGSVNPSQ